MVKSNNSACRTTRGDPQDTQRPRVSNVVKQSRHSADIVTPSISGQKISPLGCAKQNTYIYCIKTTDMGKTTNGTAFFKRYYWRKYFYNCFSHFCNHHDLSGCAHCAAI